MHQDSAGGLDGSGRGSAVGEGGGGGGVAPQRASAGIEHRSPESGGRQAGLHRRVPQGGGGLQGGESDGHSGALISAQTLRRHLEEAHALGFAFATLDEALEVLSGRRTAGKDLFVVTFDDGYRDVYRHAFPILKSMGVPAIVYLPTAHVGTDHRFLHDRLYHLTRAALAHGIPSDWKSLPAAAATLIAPVMAGLTPLPAALDEFLGLHRREAAEELARSLEVLLGEEGRLPPGEADVMDWDEVRRMSRAGYDFGAHTQRHAVLTLEPTARCVEEEIAGAKATLERELRAPVHHFAYCNGWYSDEVIPSCPQRVPSGVTTEDLLNRLGGDPYTLKRKVLWENFSLGAGELFPGAHRVPPGRRLWPLQSAPPGPGTSAPLPTTGGGP